MTQLNVPQLTIFFDSTCPLCVAEMEKLQRLDRQGLIAMVSLQDDDLERRFPALDKQKAMAVLQGLLPSGLYIEGLDVTHRAWSLVGRGYLTVMLRWPVIRWFSDRLYLWFAKNRYRVSALITGKPYCDSGSCGLSRK